MFKKIFSYIFIISCSVFVAMPAHAAQKNEEEQKDSTALFQGVSVSVDLVGPLMKAIGDYGQVEAQLRINLKDKYFPVFELGYGTGKHEEDAVTGISTKTQAPFFRIGCDYNLSKNKHDDYRMYGGLRYGFTSYNFEMSHPGVEDPVWGVRAPYGVEGERCNFHWLEAVFGLDAKIMGPFRMGWYVRYRRKISSSEGALGASWFAPGFGRAESVNWGGTFHLTFEL